MSHEVKIHDAQMLILRELLFVPSAGFADLQKVVGLESDHFKFHLKRMVDVGYVEKNRDGGYSLTRTGKEYANKLDTDANTIERQPKVSVVLIVRNQEDKAKFLVQQRLKNPYFGFWGRLGGKVRWGESFEDAASREFAEETGLTGSFSFKMLYRKRDYHKVSRELLEDKLFIIMVTEIYAGQLTVDFEGGKNAWMTQEELLTQPKHFDSAYEFVELLESDINYVAKDHYYDDEEY